MFLSLFCFLVFVFADNVFCFPISRQVTKPAYFLLVGDSTTAKPKELSYGITGGWGDGFLAMLKAPASGVNYGHNGRTTIDYRSGGDFGNVIKDLKAHKDSKDVFVTIQVCENSCGGRKKYAD
jgi:hypothetical protein